MRKKTPGEWKIGLFLKHGDRFYSYPDINDSTLWGDMITVLCPEHGETRVSLSSHFHRMSPCSVCSKQKEAQGKRVPISTRIAQANAVHNYKYDFSKWKEGTNLKDRVISLCADHGEWETTMKQIVMRKQGCPSCNGTPKKTRDQRIEEARKVHGDLYDYSLLPDNFTAHDRILIVCPEHGAIETTVNNHINKRHGCSLCNEVGFRKEKSGYLYFLRSDDGYIKIGISHDYERRINELKNETPFNFGTLAVFHHESGAEVMSVEKNLHKITKQAEFRGFSGATEWRKAKTLAILDVPELFGFTRVL